MARPKMAGLTVSPEARRDLSGLAALASGLTERRITMSEALRAAVHVARAHQDELADALGARRAE
jgi:hypothetical protein